MLVKECFFQDDILHIVCFLPCSAEEISKQDSCVSHISSFSWFLHDCWHLCQLPILSCVTFVSAKLKYMACHYSQFLAVLNAVCILLCWCFQLYEPHSHWWIVFHWHSCPWSIDQMLWQLTLHLKHWYSVMLHPLHDAWANQSYAQCTGQHCHSTIL